MGKIQKSSISPSTQRASGMQIAAEILRSIGCLSVSRIGNNSRIQSSPPNISSLTSRFKKLPTKNRAYGNL